MGTIHADFESEKFIRNLQIEKHFDTLAKATAYLVEFFKTHRKEYRE